MPTKDDRKAFEEAIKSKNEDQISLFLQRDDIKELLLMKNKNERLPITDAVDKTCLQLILDAGVKHGIAKQMLEEKTECEYTCLHLACRKNLSVDSLRLLLDYLSKHTDMKKMLEEKTNGGTTCLHLACDSNLSPDSFRLLLEYLAKHADIKKMLEDKNNDGCQTCLHLACVTITFSTPLSPDSFRLLLEHLVRYADIKKVLKEKNKYGNTCLHSAISRYSSADSLPLLLECVSKHADIKKMLEEKTDDDRTCLHMACHSNLSADSLLLLLAHLSKHTDFERMVEEKADHGFTCLHLACLNPLSVESFRLIISFFPSKDLFTRVLEARDSHKKKAIDYATNKETKELLRDPDYFEKCRLRLFLNHQDTFLYSLYPNSFEKTADALMAVLTLLPSRFREAVDKTDSSAPMAKYLDVVKKGDKKSDYDHRRKNIRLVREFYGQWPPSARETATTYQKDASGSSCSIQ